MLIYGYCGLENDVSLDRISSFTPCVLYIFDLVDARGWGRDASQVHDVCADQAVG